jgi:iron complex outermembrane recepter protein
MTVRRFVVAMSRCTCVLLLTLTAGIRPGIAAADLATRSQFDIAPQQLPSALLKFSEQSGVQVTSPGALIEGRNSPGVVGTFDARAALGKLLQNTALAYEVVDNNTVVITTPGSASGKGSRDPVVAGNRALSTSGEQVSKSDERSKDEAPKRSFRDRFRLAQVEQGSNSQSSTVENSTSTSQDNSQKVPLEEIVVTAQKREERLQDVPVPVTVISATALVESNQVRLQDYYTRVPGLSVTPEDSNGGPMITIRGVTTGALGNPTVGIVVDDVPLGSSGSVGLQVPDIDPSDLARVEVLRGPQGTLYGASSIGGLLKYVTVDPDTSRVSGRVQGGVSNVYNGEATGYNVRAAVNVPLGDTFAVRASGFARRDPGYIDDPGLAAEGVNQLNDNGGRLSALWKPSGGFSVKLSAVLQHETLHGSNNVHVQPGLGDLQQLALSGTGYLDQRVQVYTAVVKAKLGSFDLTSVSGYNINHYTDIIDYTPFFGGLNQSQFGVTGSPLHEDIKTSKFTQEVRLTAPIGEKAQWLIGAFYNHEDSPNTQDLRATDPATGVVAGTFLFDTAPQKFEEYAAFTDLTWHFTDQFDVQFGGRESQNRQNSHVAYEGPYASLFLGGSPTVYPEVYTKENSFTYLVTPRFRLSPDLMAYARLASGYRPGGPNVNAAAFGLPASYKADKTKNYELGVKGDVLNHTFSYDASFYYIDWNDIQLTLFDAQSGAGYYTNAGGAKSQGAEFSVELRPLTGLTLSAWVAYNDAELTKAFPATSAAFGNPGDRLPFSSRLSGNFAVDEEFSLTRDMNGFVGGSVSYIGNRKGVFTGSSDRQTFPSYARTDLRAGVKYETWTVNLFVNNLTDKRAALNGGIGALYPIAFNYIEPRTIGVSVADTF